jgi:hypothetical protein
LLTKEYRMRRILGVLFAGSLLLTWTGVAWTGGATDARAIVAEGIKAAGGEAALAKHESASWTEMGTYYGMGDGFPFTGKYTARLPDRFRMEIEGVFTIVFAGDKGWFVMGGETKEMTPEQLAKQKLDNRASWIAHLLPLKDKAFTLTTGPEAKVGDHPAQAVKVSRKDYPDVTLYFDKKTHLLTRCEWRTPSSEKNNMIVTQDVYYENYKDIQGAKVPTKILVKHDGQRYLEAELKDIRAGEKLDDSLFKKP